MRQVISLSFKETWTVFPFQEECYRDQGGDAEMADLHGHGQRQLLLAPGEHVRDQALQRGGQARHDGDG